jgi:Tol biopolymer transport system component
MHPCTAPDESYTVYSSRRTSEKTGFVQLISFRRSDGSQGQPQTIDLGMNAGLPFVSPDGRFLFFTGAEPGQSAGAGPGKGDVYWVWTRITEN